MLKLFETVPNFSEGRRKEVLDELRDAFKIDGVSLIDYSADPDHNRSVYTAVGDADGIKKAIIAAVGVAVKRIDLNEHEGVHPRIGAVDVIPIIPLFDATFEEAIEIARDVARQIAAKFELPVYLYGEAAEHGWRVDLASIRRGQFEGLAQKMKDPAWKPDFGPNVPHPTAGATVVGVRDFLVAFNVNLKTDDLTIAKRIARAVRASSGGLGYVKALGVELKSKGIVQVTMNILDYRRNAIYRVFELVKMEARRWGVDVHSTEIIGCIPTEAVVDVFNYYLMGDLAKERVLEYGILRRWY